MKIFYLPLIFVFTVFLSACQLLPENTHLRSYRVLVQQGNVIEESKVESLKIDMSKEQVIFLLGEPVLDNIFDNNRWDYVYFRKRDPEETQLNMVSIFFKEDKIVSMKRIVKNDDGLFEISGNTVRNKPEFIDDQEVLALQKSIFENIELEGSPIETNEIEETNETDEANEKNNLKETNKIKEENKSKDENKEVKENNKLDETKLDISKKEEDYAEPIKRKSDFEIVSEVLNQWASSWENQNLEEYFSYYTNNYTSKYFDNNDQWKLDREKRILDKNEISLEISDLSITFEINEKETATAIFQQQYTSERYSDSVKKKITLQKVGKNWKILSEILLEGEY